MLQQQQQQEEDGGKKRKREEPAPPLRVFAPELVTRVIAYLNAPVVTLEPAHLPVVHHDTHTLQEYGNTLLLEEQFERGWRQYEEEGREELRQCEENRIEAVKRKLRRDIYQHRSSDVSLRMSVETADVTATVYYLLLESHAEFTLERKTAEESWQKVARMFHEYERPYTILVEDEGFCDLEYDCHSGNFRLRAKLLDRKPWKERVTLELRRLLLQESKLYLNNREFGGEARWQRYGFPYRLVEGRDEATGGYVGKSLVTGELELQKPPW